MTEYLWQYRQYGVESRLMTEREARYWAQRENNRSASIGDEAEIRRVIVEPWEIQDNPEDYTKGI